LTSGKYFALFLNFQDCIGQEISWSRKASSLKWRFCFHNLYHLPAEKTDGTGTLSLTEGAAGLTGTQNKLTADGRCLEKSGCPV